MVSTPAEILKKYWNHLAFRPLQEEIIQSVLRGKDTIAILPTGGGKSICFQVPALLLPGICLVITPLIALMKDQVDHLKAKGISAAFLDGNMHRKEIELVLDQATAGHSKFLYISPERLQSELFKVRLEKLTISMVAIDEAHCISQWGYDFRPSYLQIHKLRKYLNVPMVALTASATQKVITDIADKLHMQDYSLFKGSFARANLSYSCFREDVKENKLLQVLQNVKGAAIVYVKSRKRTKELADFFNRKGIKSDFYHAGLPYEDRTSKQSGWVNNQIRVIVATNAFGMGIDKPNVRIVLHDGIPDTMEAYYQEAGRGGRDGQKAYAVTVFNQNDVDRTVESFDEKYPEIDFIKKVYQAVSNSLQVASGAADQQSYDFDFDDFAKAQKLDVKLAYQALKQLEHQDCIVLNESFHRPSRIFIPDRHFLYQYQVANARHDGFIKAVLRLYGGELYTDFVTINEAAIAQKLNLPKDQLIVLLHQLHMAGVWIYEPRKDKPQIHFLTQRYAVANLPFDRKGYELRKSNDKAKLDAVIRYFNDETRCRTKMILEYFDEITDDNCGICDHCISKKKSGTLPDTKSYKHQIILLLSEAPLLPAEIIEKLPGIDDERVINAIQELLEQGKLAYHPNGMLRIID